MHTAVLLALAAGTVHSTTAQICSTPQWGQCNGPKNTVLCCPYGFYCQPWSLTFYQCVEHPKMCVVSDTNYDYIGNDIAKYYGLTPGECCQRCVQHRECWLFTFVNQRPNHPPGACYIKRSAANKTYVEGAITGWYPIR